MALIQCSNANSLLFSHEFDLDGFVTSETTFAYHRLSLSERFTFLIVGLYGVLDLRKTYSLACFHHSNDSLSSMNLGRSTEGSSPKGPLRGGTTRLVENNP